MNLETFLSKAKKKTFASNTTIPKGLLFGKERSYTFKEGELTYKDSYQGTTVDQGREEVRREGRLIWEMNYQGGMLEGKEKLGRTCFRFLKTCLKNTPEEFPVRGPKHFEKGELHYHNEWEGNIEEFEGIETVTLRKEKIYEKKYSGRKIKE